VSRRAPWSGRTRENTPPGQPGAPGLSIAPRTIPASLVGYVTALGMRRQRQSVTTIVRTKATRIAFSMVRTSDASIPLSSPEMKGRRRLEASAALPRVRASRLGQVVPDVAEDVLDLPAQEDHGDDHGEGNDPDDECVLDQALTAVLAKDTLDIHRNPPFSAPNV